MSDVVTCGFSGSTPSRSSKIAKKLPNYACLFFLPQSDIGRKKLSGWMLN
jgi:hypothetical protein